MRSLLIFTLVTYIFGVAAEHFEPIPLLTVCGKWWQCLRQIDQLEEFCEDMHRNERTRRPWYIQKTSRNLERDSTSCGSQLQTEYDQLAGWWRENKAETLQCLRDQATDSRKVVDPARTKYCAIYMGDQVPEVPKTTKECWTSVKRMNNRCSALRRCCTPAEKCEANSKHSQSGKSIVAMSDEIAIKLANCKQNGGVVERTTDLRRKPNDLNKKLPKVISTLDPPPVVTSTQHEQTDGHHRISKDRIIGRKRAPPHSPPLLSRGDKEKKKLHLCGRYLDCERDLVLFRNKCNAITGIPRTGEDYSWSVAYMHIVEPLDAKDEECKIRNGKKYQDILYKQQKADAYLHECVLTVNVTHEINKKSKPCAPSLIGHIPLSDPQPETCREEIAIRKTQCNYLRDCCTQADVCERNPVYSVLADDYLISLFDLRDSMNGCYNGLLKL